LNTLAHTSHANVLVRSFITKRAVSTIAICPIWLVQPAGNGELFETAHSSSQLHAFQLCFVQSDFNQLEYKLFTVNQ